MSIKIKPEPRTIDGKTKYYYGEIPFNTFDAAQEYIDKEIFKSIVSSPEAEAMSGEDIKTVIGELADNADKKQSKIKSESI